MFTQKFIMILASSLLCALLLLAGCTGNSNNNENNATEASVDMSGVDLVKDGELTIVLSPDYPPFENMENGELIGFEVDLGKAIAKQMGLTPRFITMEFDTIIPAIVAGGVGDIGISGISVDPSRAEQIDYTTAYYVDDLGIAVEKGSNITHDNIKEMLNEKGKVIAVQTGTTGELYALENFPKATVRSYGNSTDCFAALQAKHVNAVCTNLSVVKRMLEITYNNAEIVSEIATGEEYAGIVSKRNPELMKKVNEAIENLEKDGTIQSLLYQWF